jgi:hypothetical protein
MRDLSGAQAIILCEDTAHYSFARGYLSTLGVARFVPDISPKGRGAGSAWVTERFAANLKAFRASSRYQNSILVAVIDGDGKSPAERRATLETSTSMQQLGQSPRGPGERALIIVPQWQIETWFEFVVAGSCEEKKEDGRRYEHRYRKGAKPTRWGGELAERCRKASGSELEAWPSSLQDACKEIGRL